MQFWKKWYNGTSIEHSTLGGKGVWEECEKGLLQDGGGDEVNHISAGSEELVAQATRLKELIAVFKLYEQKYQKKQEVKWRKETWIVNCELRND